MTIRTLRILIAAAALLIGVAATTNHFHNQPSGMIPWCPPYCSKGSK